MQLKTITRIVARYAPLDFPNPDDLLLPLYYHMNFEFFSTLHQNIFDSYFLFVYSTTVAAEIRGDDKLIKHNTKILPYKSTRGRDPTLGLDHDSRDAKYKRMRKQKTLKTTKSFSRYHSNEMMSYTCQHAK